MGETPTLGLNELAKQHGTTLQNLKRHLKKDGYAIIKFHTQNYRVTAENWKAFVAGRTQTQANDTARLNAMGQSFRKPASTRSARRAS